MFSSIGASIWQGPHHDAQKSTSTGLAYEASRTSDEKVSRLTSTGLAASLMAPPCGDSQSDCELH